MAKITKNFTTNEMQCPCCGKCEMDKEFMENLQKVREVCGFGFRINSAYRCAKYNAKVSKNTRGQHSTGEAADISMKAIKCGYFKDIAISKTFIHLGTGNVKNGVGVY